MKTYWRLNKRGYYSAALQLKNAVPELKSVDAELLENNLRKCDLEFYSREKQAVPLLTRLTVPFAFLLMGIMFLGLPINYIITGRWGYRFEKVNNWFRALGFL